MKQKNTSARRLLSARRILSAVMATLLLSGAACTHTPEEPIETDPSASETESAAPLTEPDTPPVTDPSTEPETEPATQPETQPEEDTEPETETEEVFDILIPDKEPTDVTPLIGPESENEVLSLAWEGRSCAQISADSAYRCVVNAEFTVTDEGLTIPASGWASVGFTRAMAKAYTARAVLRAEDNPKPGATVGVMLGVRCLTAANLHIDGGIWFVFREKSAAVHVQDGFSHTLTNAGWFNAAEGVEVTVTDDGGVLTVLADGELLCTVTVAEGRVTLTDAEGREAASCSDEKVSGKEGLGYVRVMSHFAHSTVKALEVTIPGDTYRPTPGFVAFTAGRAYGFRDKERYALKSPAEGESGSVFIDADKAARLFGLTLKKDGDTAVMSRGALTMTFTVGRTGVSVNGEEQPFPTVIRTRGVIRVAADWLARMMGYAVSAEDGTVYVAPTSEEINEEAKKDMDDRVKLYEEVVYDHDDVEADQTGSDRFKPVDPSERMVGVAYTTWHRADRQWGAGHTWDLPLLGPYCSDDEAVIRQHGEWLAEAGVDFVFVDWSNNTCYDPATMRASRADFRMIEEATDKLFEVWSTIEGAPKICIFAGPGHSGQENVDNGNHQRKVDQIYRDYVEKYPDMYFCYDGKPLLICYGATPTQYGARPRWTDDRFTVRWMTGYVGQQGGLFNAQTLSSPTYWSWEERGTQTFCVDKQKYVEAVTITAASRQQSAEGQPGYIPAYGRENGATLKRQFQRACDLGARFAIVVSWNEWTTGEQPSVEVSKDLEPSRVHGTFYLDLLTEQIRKFKGLTDGD